MQAILRNLTILLRQTTILLIMETKFLLKLARLQAWTESEAEVRHNLESPPATVKPQASTYQADLPHFTDNDSNNNQSQHSTVRSQISPLFFSLPRPGTINQELARLPVWSADPAGPGSSSSYFASFTSSTYSSLNVRQRQKLPFKSKHPVDI